MIGPLRQRSAGRREWGLSVERRSSALTVVRNAIGAGYLPCDTPASDLPTRPDIITLFILYLTNLAYVSPQSLFSVMNSPQ